MTSVPFRRLRLAAVLLSGLALAGCTDGLLPGTGDPPQLFTLTPKSTFPENLPKVPWQLTVEVPLAEAGLSNARIALQRDPISVEYYARANWIDTAPRMIQTRLVESFENTGSIVSVGRQSVALRADFSLLTDLREFQAEYVNGGDAPPRIRVRLNAKLIKMPQRTIIGTTTVERIEPAKGTDLDAVVRAFDDALGKVIKRIVTWTLTTPGKVTAETPRRRRGG